MGNNSSQSTASQRAPGTKKPLSFQTTADGDGVVVDIVAAESTDDLDHSQSPSTDVPRNSFRSRFLFRNGALLVFGYLQLNAIEII